ncbi:MAG: OmpA family protein [Proteobacteria bacterium]|nr:OmpA family protein [Pseudomonadota bacterium]MBU1714059.1 OmpA family protein [Pseudomonadota bacterium]
MSSKKNHHIGLLLLALVPLAFLVGCGGRGHVVDPDSGAVRYKASSAGEVKYTEKGDQDIVRYVKKGDTLVKVDDTRNVAVRSVEPEPVLAPIDAEFKAVDSVEGYKLFVEKYAPAEQAFVAVQRVARPAIAAHQWEKAAEVFRTYKDKFPVMAPRFDRIISILESPEENLAVKNMGPGINTNNSEYNPVISPDGKKMYFARNCGECEGGEEIFVSNRMAEGWGVGSKFVGPITTGRHEVPLAVSADGNKIAVYGNYADSLGRGDIYYTEKSAEGWSAVKHYPAPLNSKHFESNAKYAADGKAILFVSERPGGVGVFHKKDEYFHGSYGGNVDIYVYVKGENGAADQVVNLGETINTPYSEYSPFLHPDGKTLYFSSDGHPGLGGLDVFKSTRLNDSSWTAWSEPVNMGKEINGPHNDWGYQVSTPGDLAYFANANPIGGFGGSDIFSIGLPEKIEPSIKPSTVITISGTITDENGDFLVATVRWNDLELGKEVGEGESDPLTGEYFVVLPSGGKYGYYAEKEGYIGQSEHFDLRDEYEFREYINDIVLYPIKQPEISPIVAETMVFSEPEKVLDIAIRINNIFFAYDKWELREESFMELDRWVKMLVENPHLNLEIYGHTDSKGSESYNQILSEKRAKSVADYLVKNGVANDRLTSRGFGESQPIVSNDTEEGRTQNRRVEVKLNNTAAK